MLGGFLVFVICGCFLLTLFLKRLAVTLYVPHLPSVESCTHFPMADFSISDGVDLILVYFSNIFVWYTLQFPQLHVSLGRPITGHCCECPSYRHSLNILPLNYFFSNSISRLPYCFLCDTGIIATAKCFFCSDSLASACLVMCSFFSRVVPSSIYPMDPLC